MHCSSLALWKRPVSFLPWDLKPDSLVLHDLTCLICGFIVFPELGSVFRPRRSNSFVSLSQLQSFMGVYSPRVGPPTFTIVIKKNTTSPIPKHPHTSGCFTAGRGMPGSSSLCALGRMCQIALHRSCIGLQSGQWRAPFQCVVKPFKVFVNLPCGKWAPDEVPFHFFDQQGHQISFQLSSL